MEFFDLVFPQDVGALTYRAPESMRGGIVPGMLVSAELRKSVRRALVLRPCFRPPAGELKEIKSVESEAPVLSGPMLRTLEWMAEYYFATEGAVLKSVLPREFFERVRARKSRGAVAEEQAPYSFSGLDGKSREAVEAVRGNVLRKSYKTFLYHAPSTREETAFAVEAVRGAENAIVLAPEHAGMRHIERALREAAGERLVIYHGGLARGARSEAIGRMISGEGCVVLGSRSAVFAPLGKVSLIVVLQEESASYKADSGVRWNARDMAVLRGFEESATVLLTSICPSVESWHNAASGKYTLLEGAPRAWPGVRVIEARRSDGAVSRKLREAAALRLKRGERAMFVVNRAGYSMLRCSDCQEVVGCKDCGLPLVYFKAERALRCSYCGACVPAPETCPSCGGLLEPAGAGLERVAEELESLGGAAGLDPKTPLKVLSDTGEKLVLGTKGSARRAPAGEGFGLSALINADGYRYVPDFRAAERAFREMVYLADKTAPGGQLFLQSANPRATLFSRLRRFDFKGFYADELRERKALGYPPFTRMVLLSAAGAFPEVAEIGGIKGVDVLGPAPAMTKRGKRVTKLLLKSSSRKALRQALGKLLKGKSARGIAVDVDPIWA